MQEIHRTPGDPADAGQPRLEDWEVRPAQWRELPDVAAVVAAALETFRGAVPDHVLDLYIEDSRALARQWSDGEVLAGVSAGRIVGTAVYYSGAEKQGPRTASVRTLMVHPQARKRGFGRALMAYCFSTLRSAMSMSLPTDAMFDCDRRAVLMAGLTASLPGVVAGPAVAEGGRTAMTSSRYLQARLHGAMHLDERTRNAAANDFGHLVHRTPLAVVRPASAEDIAETIQWAASCGRRVAPRGQGHSVFGRSQVHDGVVIDMAQLRAVHRIQSNRIVVDAGATWSEVLASTLPQGLAPPVLTDYLQLSVGGTLAVGGVGGATSRYGMQTDNVLHLEVVTGDGRKFDCSPDENADLFEVVRAGLGQVAVITRATLRLVEAPRQVRRFLLTYPDLRTMVRDERLLAAEGRFDAVQGAIAAIPTGDWTFKIDAVKQFSDAPPDDAALLAGLSDDRPEAKPSTLSYVDYLQRFAVLEQALRANGQWFFPHPWLTTFVGDSGVETVVSRELDKLDPADLGPLGQVVLSAFRPSAVRTPLLRLPADALCYAFNLIRIPKSGDADEGGRLVTANRAAYERIRASGGTLYPVGAFQMTRDDWRRHFGATFKRLADAKQTFDAGHVLTPGYEVF